MISLMISPQIKESILRQIPECSDADALVSEFLEEYDLSPITEDDITKVLSNITNYESYQFVLSALECELVKSLGSLKKLQRALST